MLGTLTGEQESHLRRTGRGARRVVADRDVLMLGGGQHGACVGTVGHHGSHPDLVQAPARQGVGDVRQAQVLVTGEFV